MIPFWLKLLRANNNNRGYGLTLPFVVGAMRNPPGSVVFDEAKNIAEVKALLSSIKEETPDTSYVSLTVCDRLRQPVFAEGSSFFKMPEMYARLSKSKSERISFYIAPEIMTRENESIENLVGLLWGRNGKAIMQGDFSYSNGTFTKYSDSDLALISSALSMADEEQV